MFVRNLPVNKDQQSSGWCVAQFTCAYKRHLTSWKKVQVYALGQDWSNPI